MSALDQPRLDSPRLLLALMTPPDVTRLVEPLIKVLSDRYQTRTARVAPHITVQAPFRWPSTHIAELEQSLHRFTQNHRALPIYLSGFGSFGKKVIYIQVKKSLELMTLQAVLAHHLATTFQITDPHAKQRSFNPHLTVASRKLTPQSFAQAWQYLQQYSIEYQYVSDRLTLLTYDEHQWHIYRDFPFLSSNADSSASPPTFQNPQAHR